ncbi:MAG: CHAD domain-containing protein [Burkholderiales bacterium]
MEIELKFAISQDAARKLAHLSLVKGAATGRAVTRRMHSVYYDTPDLALQAQRIGLRLRREGSRWVQTLKAGGAVEGGLHQREEHETVVPARLLDYTALTQWGLAELIADPEQRARLQPAFTCDFTRTTRHLAPAPGTQIELCLDRGTIVAGAAAEPVDEIELELKAGAPQSLIDFALQLIEHLPLRLEPRSKAERGYALAAQQVASPVKATTPALEEGMSVTAALRSVVFSCLAQLQANEAGTIAGTDVEYLHQARVALRRLRSAFSVFRRAFPRAAYEDLLVELRWLSGQLGPARDWDVFVFTMLPQVARAFGDDAAMQTLVQRADTQRTDAGRQACEAIASRRYTALLLGLNSLFCREPWRALPDEAAAELRARPLPQFAAEMLSQRQRKVITLGRKHAQPDAAALHRLRIEIKKLRYAAEFFSALYARKAVRSYTSALSALQELLGTLNDAATVERLCAILREGDIDAPQREALGAVRGWAAATTRNDLEQVPQAWKRFREVHGFW